MSGYAPVSSYSSVGIILHSAVSKVLHGSVGRVGFVLLHSISSILCQIPVHATRSAGQVLVSKGFPKCIEYTAAVRCSAAILYTHSMANARISSFGSSFLHMMSRCQRNVHRFESLSLHVKDSPVVVTELYGIIPVCTISAVFTAW